MLINVLDKETKEKKIIDITKEDNFYDKYLHINGKPFTEEAIKHFNLLQKPGKVKETSKIDDLRDDRSFNDINDLENKTISELKEIYSQKFGQEVKLRQNKETLIKLITN